MEQLNKIIEACEYASDAYWGNPERFQFRAFIIDIYLQQPNYQQVMID